MAMEASIPQSSMLTDVGKRRLMFGLFFGVSIVVHLGIFFLLGTMKVVRDVQATERQFRALAVVEADGQAAGLSDAETLAGLPQFQTTQLLDTEMLLNLDLPEIKIADLGLAGGDGALGLGGLGDLDFGNVGATTAPALRVSQLGFDANVSSGAFKGYIFDLKRNSKGIPLIEPGKFDFTSDNPNSYTVHLTEMLRAWVSKSWSLSELTSNYFLAAEGINRNHFVEQSISVNGVPGSLGVEGKASPGCLLGYFEGQYLVPKAGQYRFLGRADGVLIVRLNNRIMLDASSQAGTFSTFGSQGNTSPLFSVASPGFIGSWMNLRAGQKLKIEVLLGHIHGSKFGSYLLLQAAGGGGLPQIFSLTPLNDEEKRELSRLPDANGRF